jgi:hypothetical protein
LRSDGDRLTQAAATRESAPLFKWRAYATFSSIATTRTSTDGRYAQGVAPKRWRCAMAATNKCLARSNKSCTGTGATKKRNGDPQPGKGNSARCIVWFSIKDGKPVVEATKLNAESNETVSDNMGRRADRGGCNTKPESNSDDWSGSTITTAASRFDSRISAAGLLDTR